MKRSKAAVAFWVLAMITGWSLHTKSADECAPAGGFNFICGPASVEDLVQVPGTRWIIGSGMPGKGKPGSLNLFNAAQKTWEILYPGANPQNQQDLQSYPSCSGAPDPKTFGAHGIAVRDDSKHMSTVLAVNHGREAIEVFRLNAREAKPVITWIGCVPLDEHTFANSVAFLPGGGVVYTKYYDPKAPGGFGAMMERKITGSIFEWHPETGIKPIAGTELSGANGIVVSKDGKTIYAAAWGSHEIVRFSVSDGSVQSRKSVPVDFWPDNLRWAPDGTILIAGQYSGPAGKNGFPSFKGWSVVKLEPETLKIAEVVRDKGESRLQNASVAIEADGMLWIGTFMGDRVAYRPLK
jgi:hypothetical protein